MLAARNAGSMGGSSLWDAASCSSLPACGCGIEVDCQPPPVLSPALAAGLACWTRPPPTPNPYPTQFNTPHPTSHPTHTRIRLCSMQIPRRVDHALLAPGNRAELFVK